MAFNATITETAAQGGLSLSKTNTLTGSWRQSIDETVADSASDYLVSFALDVSETKLFYMISTLSNITVETNDSGAPANTIALLAGIPYVFYTGKYDAFKLTTDVTKLYLTNTGGVETIFRIEVLADATP